MVAFRPHTPDCTELYVSALAGNPLKPVKLLHPNGIDTEDEEDDDDTVVLDEIDHARKTGRADLAARLMFQSN